MNIVKIGSEQRPLGDVTEQWISEQLRRRQSDKSSICIQVVLKSGALDMVLSTGDCPSGGGGGRQANDREQEVFNLWAKHGLSRQSPNPGILISFLKQLQRSL